jgi:ABC-type transporter lipoprotein component MlaA
MLIGITRFLPQCNRALLHLNLQLDYEGLRFHRSVPRRLRDGYAAFREAYRQRRRAQLQAASGRR